MQLIVIFHSFLFVNRFLSFVLLVLHVLNDLSSVVAGLEDQILGGKTKIL